MKQSWLSENAFVLLLLLLLLALLWSTRKWISTKETPRCAPWCVSCAFALRNQCTKHESIKMDGFLRCSTLYNDSVLTKETPRYAPWCVSCAFALGNWCTKHENMKRLRWTDFFVFFNILQWFLQQQGLMSFTLRRLPPPDFPHCAQRILRQRGILDNVVPPLSFPCSCSTSDLYEYYLEECSSRWLDW